MLSFLADHFNYMAVVILMMTGLYIVISSGNLIKKMMGLSVFQTSVFLLYISIGNVKKGVPPILDSIDLEHGEAEKVSQQVLNPLPLTAGGTESTISQSHDAGASLGSVTGKMLEQTTNAATQSGNSLLHHTTEALSQTGAVLLHSGKTIYSNPLPHVLILTAIVVGVATLAVGLALVVRIREVYGSIEEVEIDRADYVERSEGSSYESA